MLNWLLKIWLALVLGLALAGCATDRPFGTAPNIEVTDLTQLPVPASARTFQLRSLDSVEITVLQDTSLGGTYLIDASGQLPFPLVGPLAAEGLSPSQLGQQISSRLSNGYIVNPDVIVRPTELRDVSVSFGGEIKKPGNYVIGNAPTLLRGVNAAGGLTNLAKGDDVLIMRGVDGQNYIGVYNLGAIQRGNYADPALIPGDVVMVGDSPARRRLTSFLEYLSIVTSSVILFDRVAN